MSKSEKLSCDPFVMVILAALLGLQLIWLLTGYSKQHGAPDPVVQAAASKHLDAVMPKEYVKLEFGPAPYRPAIRYCEGSLARVATPAQGRGFSEERSLRVIYRTASNASQLSAELRNGHWHLNSTSLTQSDSPDLLKEEVSTCLTYLESKRAQAATDAVESEAKAKANRAAWASEAR